MSELEKTHKQGLVPKVETTITKIIIEDGEIKSCNKELINIDGVWVNVESLKESWFKVKKHLCQGSDCEICNLCHDFEKEFEGYKVK